ncbi:MAG: response regulator, partial [Candidatus Eisenbacteria bacterium]|nr:response regulator [Candidatus Eisenbacteria bacterium]
MKALVVDPSAAVRRIASRALESLGCEEIIEAQDGASALTLLDAADVQLVLTEWSLPGGGGHESVSYT